MRRENVLSAERCSLVILRFLAVYLKVILDLRKSDINDTKNHCTPFAENLQKIFFHYCHMYVNINVCMRVCLHVCVYMCDIYIDIDF
jgi:hypothetical protein